MRRIILVLAAVVVVMRAFTAAPAMAQPFVEQPIQQPVEQPDVHPRLGGPCRL